LKKQEARIKPVAIRKGRKVGIRPSSAIVNADPFLNS
jgi:hypothetical protein